MVRSYEPGRPVPPDVADRIVRNGLRAPSAGFSQGWGFVVLDNPADIGRFRDAVRPEAHPEDWFAANVDAPLLIIAHSNKDAYLDRYARPDKGFPDRSDTWWPAPYWDIDTGFASLLMLLTAVDAGLGACFFGIPADRIGAYRAAFGGASRVQPDRRDFGRLQQRTAAGPGRPAQTGRRNRAPRPLESGRQPARGTRCGDQAVTVVALRLVTDQDLDALFEQMRDPAAVWMAAFTAPDPADRNAFDAHLARVRSSPDIVLRAVTCDGQLVGSAASFPAGGQTEVTYWIDRAAWSRGIATQALALLLDLIPARPLYARAASDNAGSLRVLQKAGFTAVGTERSFAPGRNQEIEETILRLDG